ncbi:hypothetical protein CIPAW_15G028000 [Carya illinoinensis]|uniref:Uncharacterized protein n=1 Tax=Carya illinoinensis TaxID=32201 RepID=A0A8T1N8J5_CARIL|nr:hypothetical protein CIPAW_15G028000 [Carya illinoinensis]
MKPNSLGNRHWDMIPPHFISIYQILSMKRLRGVKFSPDD